MKKGISIWAFPEDWALTRSFALAAEAGFDGIEMAYAADGPIHPHVTASELADLRNAARNAGLEITSLASGIFWSVNLISDNTQEREAAKQHLRRMLEVAADLEDTEIPVRQPLGQHEGLDHILVGVALGLADLVEEGRQAIEKLWVPLPRDVLGSRRVVVVAAEGEAVAVEKLAVRGPDRLRQPHRVAGQLIGHRRERPRQRQYEERWWQRNPPCLLFSAVVSEFTGCT